MCWTMSTSLLKYDRLCAGLRLPLCWNMTTSVLDNEHHLFAGVRRLPLCWTATTSVLDHDGLCDAL